MAVATKTRPVVMDLPKAPVKEACQHHWIIEAANGPSSKGRCKFCGAGYIFSNSMPMENWTKASAAVGRELALLDRIGGY